jgi:hypothetical protein
MIACKNLGSKLEIYATVWRIKVPSKKHQLLTRITFERKACEVLVRIRTMLYACRRKMQIRFLPV